MAAEKHQRRLSTIRDLLWPFFGDIAKLQAFRKYHGGHWERWWIGSPINSLMWISGISLGERPGLGEQLFVVEDYDEPT